MFCSISGQVPKEPVVSLKSGHLFEKRLIEKFIEADGKCPLTHQTLTFNDLIPVQVSSIVNPRPLKCASVPGLLETLANEWDDAMIESFQLRQELDLKRKELSQSLYQFDAACRTIGRLLKERDERVQSTDAKTNDNDNDSRRKKVRVEVDEIRLNEELIQQLTSKSMQLSKSRKSRTVPQADQSILSSSVKSPPVDMHNPITCMASCLSADFAVGLMNGALITRINNQKNELHGHSSSISSLAWNGIGNSLVSASTDGQMNYWQLNSTTNHAIPLPCHNDHVTGIMFHPLDQLVLSSSLDGSWKVFNLTSHSVVNSVTTTDPITSSALHPDGLLYGVSSLSGISIWDLKNSTIGGKANFERNCKINAIDFSENGYYMASGDDCGNAVVWDLRKLKPVHSYASNKGAVSSIKFDITGNYVAYASGRSLGIGIVKLWESNVVVENVAADVISSISFANQAIITASMDGFVNFLT